MAKIERLGGYLSSLPATIDLVERINALIDSHNEREEEQSEEWEKEFDKWVSLEHDFFKPAVYASDIKQFIRDNFIPRKDKR
jgi:hypothetical protein